jgi:hypothetical protein
MSTMLLLLAVCVAAFVAHLTIDFVGDFALPHDTYDDIGHTSRIGTLVGALGFVLVAFLRLVTIALTRSGSAGTTIHALARSLIRSPWRFGCAVALLTIVAVGGMEATDAALSGQGLDGIDDAFGGSAPLGLAITLLCAALVSVLVARCTRMLAVPCDLVIRLLGVLGALPRRARAVASCVVASRSVRPRRRQTVHAYRAAKRGPPLLAA